MKRPLRWSTPLEVRASLAKIANEVRNGELTPAQGNAIVGAANSVLSCIRIFEQEGKIAAIEKQLEIFENRKG